MLRKSVGVEDLHEFRELEMAFKSRWETRHNHAKVAYVILSTLFEPLRPSKRLVSLPLCLTNIKVQVEDRGAFPNGFPGSRMVSLGNLLLFSHNLLASIVRLSGLLSPGRSVQVLQYYKTSPCLLVLVLRLLN